MKLEVKIMISEVIPFVFLRGWLSFISHLPNFVIIHWILSSHPYFVGLYFLLEALES